MPIKHDQRQDVPDWLAKIKFPGDKTDFIHEFPLGDVLSRSLYYPASGFDDRPVQFLGGFVHSFVYVDCSISDPHLRPNFFGYTPAATRNITRTELAPENWKPVLPPEFPNLVGPAPAPSSAPFAWWTIFQRDSDMDESHGPERLSFLFICGDGIATYQALYTRNSVCPFIIAVIPPVPVVAGSYTDFRAPQGLLAHTVLRANGTHIPAFAFCETNQNNGAAWPETYGNLVDACDNVGLWAP